MSKQGHVLIAEMLETTLDFKQKSSDVGVTTYGCFATRQGIEAPHSFVLKLGRGLTLKFVCHPCIGVVICILMYLSC